MNDPALRDLDMLQAIETRMASNQRICRAWTVPLGIAIIDCALWKDGKTVTAALALLPAICFWTQDVYYLGLERAFLQNSLMQPPQPAAGRFKLSDFDITPEPGDFTKAVFRPIILLVHLPVVLLAITVWSHP